MHFHEASINLIPKPDKTSTKKKTTKNYRPILIVNLDINTLNKILANHVSECIKRSIPHYQVGFIPGMQSLGQ